MKAHVTHKLLILPLLAILFSSCNSWIDTEFTPLPAELYAAYEQGDTFMYKSILTEDIDTFLVEDFIMDTLYDGYITYERSAGLFREIVADTLGDNFFLVANEPSGALFSWDSAYIVFQNVGTVLDTTMQGFDYTGLFVATRSRQDTVSEKLHKIYFDWGYGMVKYVYNSLDTYELFYRPE